MKTAKAVPSDLSSSRRAQPVRQTRVNPPRSSIPSSRAFGPRGPLNSGLEEREIEIFPAITHFADAITALPKELMRHFTLLKEVDAKIFGPEEDLGTLVNAALNTPLPERRPQVDTQPHGPASTTMSAQGSTNGSIVNGHPASVALVPDADVSNFATMAYEPANIPRRQIFQHCAYTMQNMLVSLEEKNHVLSSATEALNKQLARIDDCFPYIELEISEEARNGSTTHWAYPENRLGRSSAANSSRRDVAPVNTLSAAAQALADEAAQRSEARKQALLDKKKNHNKPQAESDFDDHHESRPKEKKVHGNSKVRKAAETPSTVGLGITNGTTTNGHAPKRRKVEKGPAGGVVMERALSGVLGTNGTTTKGKVASPRETPGPDGPKKKPRGTAAANGQPRKRNNTVTTAMSPSLASSPVRSAFPDPKTTGRATPPPTNGARPATSRVRQNSIHSLAETARTRQESVPLNKPNGNSTIVPEVAVTSTTNGRIIPEVKPVTKEVHSKPEPVVEEVEKNGAVEPERIIPGTRRDSVPEREEPEVNGGAVQSLLIATVVTTKSGRASKPSTPAMPSFPDPPRSRSSRTALDATSNKRSHKKGAGAAAQLIAQQNMEMDDTYGVIRDEEEEEEEIGADEPTYCYCNGVSYGEMVACDANACAKEWFHLECAGLKVAPKGNAKWYCNECKERMKPKRFNSR
ncbi:hypothetical protein HYALB_00000531 [Hymenoscyphus albidus]|uniref:Chromatin modification-related protein n=1 Tax=Hymenoscyphus albidus TaxID=595503 RepID=A0A9N9M3B5_9HELO|nr:hypothetical protein HYALB_00000531 [Hymenoscyphus albidus]